MRDFYQGGNGWGRGSLSGLDVMGALVSGEVGLHWGPSFGSIMVVGRISHFVADETFVVSNVFGSLDQCQIDSVHIHGIWITLGAFGSR